MALVRIFLLTCRRSTLLPRALDSLRRQTFTDWICELHNDAPEDDSPRQLLDKINDPRISLHQHSQSWGAVKSFRHVFLGGEEPFSSLLEDDNWWEPEFLDSALKALQSNPDATLAWANLNIWRENADHSWSPTGHTIWKQASKEDDTPLIFRSIQPIQCFNALHSNGATLFRSDISRAAPIPEDTPFAIIECVRERLLPGSFILLPKPLGYFAVTLKTARSSARESWIRSQLLCAASYQLTVRPSKKELSTIWSTLREQHPPATNLLFYVALAGVRPWAILSHAKGIDWFRFLRSALFHPLALIRGLRFRAKHPKTWKALLSAPTRPKAESSAQCLYEKIL